MSRQEIQSARRSLVEASLAALGACGPYGLLRFKSAGNGDGWVIGGSRYRIEGVLDSGKGAERLLLGMPNGMPAWLEIGTYRILTGPEGGSAALFADPCFPGSGMVDLIILAPKSVEALRWIAGKPFSGEVVKRRVCLSRVRRFPLALAA